MAPKVPDRLTSTFDEEELRGFSRSMADLQWLLIILAMLYFFIPTRPISDTDAMIITLLCYSGLVMLFRYLSFHARETRWKLAIETWAMIGFITAILWYTGMVDSPLLNLYLLVIIACAITLGKIMTMLEVGLIACCYLYMGYQIYSVEVIAPATFTMLMAKFSPFLLVAYVTSMLASDIKSAKNKITVMSQTDELTGLLNLRAFNIVLEKEVATAARYSTPYTVMMIDVDGLKQINDHFGHSTGSRLVKIVASSLKNCVRSSDVLARYGGDELIILAPFTNLESAQKQAELLCQSINNMSLDPIPQISCSFGVVEFTQSRHTADNLIGAVDKALYEAKANGRNCTVSKMWPTNDRNMIFQNSQTAL